jgi:ureidoacrylate peracid hydrolase
MSQPAGLATPALDPAADVFSAHRHGGGVRLDPSHAALVVVDMINEFCKPGGLMVLPGYEALVPPQRALIDRSHDLGVPVIFVIDSHRRGMRLDREFLKRTPHGEEGTWATEVIDEIAPAARDHRVIKHRYSAFFGTDLDILLRDLRVTQVVVMGVVTNICVRSTVHDAFFLGYEVVVPRDACAATGPREQESSLYDIATHFGVVSTAAVVGAGMDGSAEIANEVPPV